MVDLGYVKLESARNVRGSESKVIVLNPNVRSSPPEKVATLATLSENPLFIELIASHPHLFIERDGQRVGLAQILDSKTGVGRLAPLNPVAAKIAEQWISGAPGEYVFCCGRSDRLGAGNRNSAYFRDKCKKIGLQNLRWHDLRHTAATRAADNGATTEEVQQLLGHSSIIMTERYIKRSKSGLWAAALAICKPKS